MFSSIGFRARHAKVESVGHFDIRSEGRNDNGATPLDPKLGEYLFDGVICYLFVASWRCGSRWSLSGTVQLLALCVTFWSAPTTNTIFAAFWRWQDHVGSYFSDQDNTPAVCFLRLQAIDETIWMWFRKDRKDVGSSTNISLVWLSSRLEAPKKRILRQVGI